MLEEARSDMECMKCQIEQKSRMQQLADRSRGPPAEFRGLLASFLAVPPRTSPGIWDSARAPRTHCSSPNVVPARSSRGIRNSAKAEMGASLPSLRGPWRGIPRTTRTPRRLSLRLGLVWVSGFDSGWFQLQSSTTRLILTRSKRQ